MERSDSYRAAIEQRPDYSLAQHDLGLALYEAGELEESVDKSSPRGGRAGDSFPLAWHKLGVALYDLGENDEAITAYRTAIEQRGGRYAEAHYNLGNALYARGEMEEAVAHTRRQSSNSAATSRTLTAIWVTRLRDSGDLDRAADSIKQAISQGDTAADAHHDLGLILYGRGQLEEAIGEFRPRSPSQGQ